MAITISTQPSTTIMQTAYRAIRYYVTSNAATISKVQCEVYINGVLKKTLVHDPQINTTNEFEFDIRGIVRDNLNFYLPFTLPFPHYIAQSSNNSVYIHCVFNEVLLTGGVLEVQATDYTSSTSYACNATLQYEDVSTLNNWYQDSPQRLFMSNSPNNQRIKRGETTRLSFITNLTSIDSILYQYSGTTLLSTTTVNAAIASTVKRGQITINTNYFDTSCDNFIINLSSSSTRISEERTFRIVDEACEDHKRIWFLNQFGDFEPFTFEGEFVEGLEVSSKEFKKVLAYNFSVGDRGVKTFRVDAFEKFRTSTRPLNREEYRWLRELKTSPEVFLQEDDCFIPIILLNRDNYSIKGDSIGEPMVLEYIKANDLVIQ